EAEPVETGEEHAVEEITEPESDERRDRARDPAEPLLEPHGERLARGQRAQEAADLRGNRGARHGSGRRRHGRRGRAVTSISPIGSGSRRRPSAAGTTAWTARASGARTGVMRSSCAVA